MRICASEIREEIWNSQCSLVNDATKIHWWLKGNFCQAAEPNIGYQGCNIKQEAQISYGQVLMVLVWQFSQGTPYIRPSLPNSHRSPLDNMVFPNLPSFQPPWEKPQVEYTIYSVPCLVTKTHILRKPGSEMSPGQQAGTHVTPHVFLAGPGCTQQQCRWSIISDFCLLWPHNDTATGFCVFQKSGQLFCLILLSLTCRDKYFFSTFVLLR